MESDAACVPVEAVPSARGVEQDIAAVAGAGLPGGEAFHLRLAQLILNRAVADRAEPILTGALEFAPYRRLR